MPECMAFRPLQLANFTIHNLCMKARRSPARLLLLLAIPFLTWTGCSLSTKNTGGSPDPTPDTAQLAANPASLQFGTIPSTSRKTLSETISNSGGTALTVSQIVATGAGFGFSGITPPVTLSPGQSATFKVSFAPSSAGTQTGTLDIDSNASNSTVPIALSGTATSPGLVGVTPASVNFGSVVVGTSKTQTASLSASNGPVTIDSANLSGSEFSVSGLSLPVTIPSGSSVSFDLIFSPQASGSTSGSVTFSGSATNSGLSATLSGTGIAPPQHKVQLSWHASTSSGVIGYYLYRSTTSGGPYTQISSLDSSTSATDNTVASGETYYYVVTAVDSSSQESAYSNQVTAVIPSP